jgi:hypothetical protein
LGIEGEGAGGAYPRTKATVDAEVVVYDDLAAGPRHLNALNL